MDTHRFLVPALLLICSPIAWTSQHSYQIVALSSRPDKISGGDALVRIHLPEGVSFSTLAEAGAVRLNDDDVTGAFRSENKGRSFLGRVDGLKLGRNTLQLLRTGETTPSAQLELVNHPRRGPVFSGPQEQPYICETATFKLPDGTLLGDALDHDCSSRTVVTYLYRASHPELGENLKPLPDRTVWPKDVAMTTTSAGQTVPYIVRIETGTINRAIYQIAVLHDPVSESQPEPFTPGKGWNRRLLYSFGGGCTGGWFRQGSNTGLSLHTSAKGTLTDSVLSLGYAYASASLNVFGNNCQDVTAAETMMMVKEHFIETYGVPAFTFGRGGSGGAYQQIQIADNYPGLLDGIIPSATFPDVLATIQYLTDAQLLNAYYAKSGSSLTNEQKRAIAGVGVLPSVTRVSSGAGRINPQVFCPPQLPVELRYDPSNNPAGARCDVYDHTVNVYGRDAATGFARRPLDNTGVQYGLGALNAGIITPRQFLDLNEKLGGYDGDGNLVPARSVADPAALRAAHSTGRVAHGGGGLKDIPILDLRGYLDLNPAGDLHMKYHSYAFRERLRRANGTVANHVLVVSGPASRGLEEYTIAKMDQWLTNLAADTINAPVIDKIARTKPADLVDFCDTPTRERIAEPQTFSGGECNRFYPTFPSPRMVAGGPMTNDVLKCQLKPIDLADYQTKFTGAEQSRLKQIFAGGVCDWSKPGVSQSQLSGVWLSY